MPPSLMRCKHGFCEASRLKQRKCQQNRIAHNAPNAADDVIRKGQVLKKSSLKSYDSKLLFNAGGGGRTHTCY